MRKPTAIFPNPRWMPALVVLVLLLLGAAASAAGAQPTLQDVVYLKNGSVIRGMILEQIPNKTIKIQTADGSIFVYEMTSVVKIVKEAPPAPPAPPTPAEKPAPPATRPAASMEQPAARAAEAPAPGGGARSARPLGGAALVFNPLGFLQFGPQIQVEFRVSDSFVLGPHVAFRGLGLLSNLMTDENETLNATSMGFGIGGRGFFGNAGSPNRWYAGAVAEYYTGSSREPGDYESYYEDYEYKTTAAVFMTNFGYRWRFPSGFFVGAGVQGGVISELSSKQEYPFDKEYEKKTTFAGMGDLTIGVEF
jgi:hypothetical protein